MGPLQFCLTVILGIHRNPKQKEFFNLCEGFLRYTIQFIHLDESLRWPLFLVSFLTRKEVEYHKTCFFGVLGEYWRGPRGTGSAKFYSSGNRGVRKWPRPRGRGSLGFFMASLMPIPWILAGPSLLPSCKLG